MDKRIELERRGKKPSEIVELCLDNHRATQIEGLTDEYTSLKSLSMINIGLTTLKGFPKLPKLEKLELSDNRISNSLNVLEFSPNLKQLNLSGNKVKDIEALEPLKMLKNLTHLDLFNNPLPTDEMRAKIFEMLPNLKFLDGTDINDVEDDDSDIEEIHNGAGDGEEEEEDEEEGEDGENAVDEGEEGENAVDDGEEEEEEGEEEGEEEEEDDSDDEEADGPGLASIYNDNLENDEDEENYEYVDEEDDKDHEIEDEEDADEPSEKKRKVEEDEK